MALDGKLFATLMGVVCVCVHGVYMGVCGYVCLCVWGGGGGGLGMCVRVLKWCVCVCVI